MPQHFSTNRILPDALLVYADLFCLRVDLDNAWGKTFLEFLRSVWRNGFRDLDMRQQTI